jgi:hypothetical protein
MLEKEKLVRAANNENLSPVNLHLSDIERGNLPEVKLFDCRGLGTHGLALAVERVYLSPPFVMVTLLREVFSRAVADIGLHLLLDDFLLVWVEDEVSMELLPSTEEVVEYCAIIEETAGSKWSIIPTDWQGVVGESEFLIDIQIQQYFLEIENEEVPAPVVHVGECEPIQACIHFNVLSRQVMTPNRKLYSFLLCVHVKLLNIKQFVRLLCEDESHTILIIDSY